MRPKITLMGAVFGGGDGVWRLMRGSTGRRAVGCKPDGDDGRVAGRGGRK